MKKTFKATLSTKSISDLIVELEKYTYFELPYKCDLFIQKLAETGIRVAIANVYSDFAPCVDFTYEPIGECQGELVGKTTKFIHRVWYKKNGDVSGEYDISPIAMAEFGAGLYASTNPWGLPSTRGSLGKNGMKDVWYWYDEGGQKHSSDDDSKIVPQRPMYRAFVEMMDKCQSVAKEVFGQ